MRGKKIIECKVIGRVSVWANPPYEQEWKSRLEQELERAKPRGYVPLKKFSVKLDFHIKGNRIKQGNDLDNLAKPILDSLVRVGLIPDDPLVYNLELTKHAIAGEEMAFIKIWEWLED